MEKTMTDKAIIEAFRQESEDLHDQVLYHVYFQLNWRQLVINHVLKNSGDEQEGEDIASNTLESFFENLRNGKFKGKSKLETYFLSIAKKKWLTHLRRRKIYDKLPAKLAQKTGNNVERQYLDEEAKELFYATLKSMGKDCDNSTTILTLVGKIQCRITI